jgi:hypothetical protein
MGGTTQAARIWLSSGSDTTPLVSYRPTSKRRIAP